MAGAGHKLWAAGDVVGATGGTSINTYLQDQIVGVYADSSARDAAFGGAGEPLLAEGMVCFLADTNVLQIYTGSAWVPVADTDVMIFSGKNIGIGTATPSNFGGTLVQIQDAAIASLLITDGTATFQTNVTAAATYTGTRSAHDFSIVSSNAVRMTVAAAGAVHVAGAFSKGSGSFDIPHPTKGGDWRLRHSFIEGPQADLVYRGTVTLSGGTATVDLDTASNMTAGTWEALCRDPWTMVASSGNAVEWSLSGKTLTITSDTADAVCAWLVIAERQDDHMKSENGAIADADGHLVVEYEAPPMEILFDGESAA